MELRADGWYHYNPQIKKLEKVAPPIKITEKQIDFETRENTVKIEDNKGNNHTDSSETLNSRNIESLAKYGFPITPQNKNLLSGALLNMSYGMDHVYIYKSVGLIIKEGSISYHGDRMISTDGTEGKLSADGPYTLKPSGTLKDWVQMYKKHVEGTPYLELAVALGISGIFIHYYQKQGIDLHSPIVHFYEDSSKGKTTLTQLALSVAGHPGKKNGLFKNWNSTSNAIISMLTDNWGIPILFDEISTYGAQQNISSLIYTLSDGLERARADQNGNAKKQGNWSTVILSTGEVNMDELSTSKRNTGIGVRILQFNGEFTKDAAQSEGIKKIIEKNHGHILPKIAAELIESAEENMTTIFHRHYEKFYNALDGTSDLVSRVSNLYAAIAVAAEAFNRTFRSYFMEIDEQQLFDLLVNHEKTISTSRNLGEQAHEKLVQYLISNQHKIADERSSYTPSSGTIGFFKSLNEETMAINLLKNEFTSFVENENFQGSVKIAKALSNKGYFVTSSGDRIAEQVTVEKGKREPFYTLKLSSEDEDLFTALKAKKSNYFLESAQKYDQQNELSPKAADIFKTAQDDHLSEIMDEDIQI